MTHDGGKFGWNHAKRQLVLHYQGSLRRAVHEAGNDAESKWYSMIQLSKGVAKGQEVFEFCSSPTARWPNQKAR